MSQQHDTESSFKDPSWSRSDDGSDNEPTNASVGDSTSPRPARPLNGQAETAQRGTIDAENPSGSDAHAVVKLSRSDKWLAALVSMSEPKFRRTFCCKKLKCFRQCDYNFFLTNARRMITLSASMRRSILQSLVGSDKRFHFYGRVVCVVFLKDCFHFSTVLQAEISTGRITRNLSTSTSTSSRRSTQTLVSASSCSPVISEVKKKEAIISVIERIAEDFGDLMPHRSETHLPFYQYQELFPPFTDEFEKLYPGTAKPGKFAVSEKYLYRTWRTHCPHIKILKASRFASCDTCEEIRTALRENILAGESTIIIKTKWKIYLNFVGNERLEYQKKRGRARLHNNGYLPVIVDGADQSAFGLPHFTSQTKREGGHAMKVKLVGSLYHRLQNFLFLNTMTQEHAAGANHLVEVLHRFLNHRRVCGPLPPKCFLQIDNCTRENKNRFLMAYFELLAAKGVFSSVEVCFLPVGHTHEDVDQAVSQMCARLRVRNAITLSDLHDELRATYGGRVQVENMRWVANWSGLCENGRCLQTVDRISHWRYFLFSADEASARSADEVSTGSAKSSKQTSCHVKKNAPGPWVPLFPLSASKKRTGLLHFCPDLSKTPDLSITCPDGLPDVDKRLDSEAGRINNPNKLADLHSLRDFVFQSRVDSFHWGLGNSVETEFNTSNNPSKTTSSGAENTDDVIEAEAQEHEPSDAHNDTGIHHLAPHFPSPETPPDTEVTPESERIEIRSHLVHPHSKFKYPVGSFVVVQTEQTNDNDKETVEGGQTQFVTGLAKFSMSAKMPARFMSHI